MKKFLMIFLMILLFTLTGCSNENPMVGRWEFVDGEVVDGAKYNISDIEFKSDKTLIIKIGDDVVDATYTYDNSSKKVELDLDGEKAEGVLEMSEDKESGKVIYIIVLKDSDGDSLTLKKIK